MSASKSSRLSMLWTSTIGLKVIMAVSGLMLVGFVLGHMAGNLQIFLGKDTYNGYAHFMQGLGELLWVARISLLVLLTAHVASAVKLTQRNREARPQAYAGLRTQRTTVHAKIMLLSGLVIIAFVVYHLAHYTVRTVHTEYMNPADPTDVYTFFVQSFQDPLIVATYVIANLLLASHLAHATSSMFRTLGLSVGEYRPFFEKIGPAVGILVAVGNLSMPLACLLGIVTV